MGNVLRVELTTGYADLPSGKNSKIPFRNIFGRVYATRFQIQRSNQQVQESKSEKYW